MSTQQALANLPVFKTVMRGGHTSPANSKALLESAGFKLDPVVADILAHADYSDTREELEVVLVSNADLGLPRGGPRSETYRLASEQGLDPLPHWGASALAEACTDLPLFQWFLIAMEPIEGSDGNTRVFYLEHSDHSLGFDSRYCGPDFDYDGSSDTSWAFVRRK